VKFLNAPREKDLQGHLETADENKKTSSFKRNEDVQKRLDKDNQLRLAASLVQTLPRIKTLN
jgi:carboxyl-terminal processing protease